MQSNCSRCGRVVKPTDGFVLYIHPDPASTDRIVVHGICIADEVAEGRVERVSPFAFRAVAAPEPPDNW